MADTATGAYSADPMFQQYYNEILASMTPQTIDYQAPTADEIAAQISAYLRPSVDQQIRDRQQSTLQQRAATDADAASRGILASTWVTDIKNRLMQSEAADVAAAESDYRAQLLQGVYNRQAAEADRANQIAMFNAQMRQQAESDAYKRAADMYNLYLQNKSSSGGGRGGGSDSDKPSELTNDDDAYERFLGAQKALETSVAGLATRLPMSTPIGRATGYTAMRGGLTGSVGGSGLKLLNPKTVLTGAGKAATTGTAKTATGNSAKNTTHTVKKVGAKANTRNLLK